MYIDEEHHSAREFCNGLWQVDTAIGLCCQPLIFWYLDIDKLAGIRTSAFDIVLWNEFSSNPHPTPWDSVGQESVTRNFVAAADYSEDFESVTEEKTCQICGADLSEKRGHAMTCSPKCRKILSRRK